MCVRTHIHGSCTHARTKYARARADTQAHESHACARYGGTCLYLQPGDRASILKLWFRFDVTSSSLKRCILNRSKIALCLYAICAYKHNQYEMKLFGISNCSS